MFRYKVVEVARVDHEARDELLWETGRSGWELIQVIPGSDAAPDDHSTLTLWFKRAAGEDIGM